MLQLIQQRLPGAFADIRAACMAARDSLLARLGPGQSPALLAAALLSKMAGLTMPTAGAVFGNGSFNSLPWLTADVKLSRAAVLAVAEELGAAAVAKRGASSPAALQMLAEWVLAKVYPAAGATFEPGYASARSNQAQVVWVKLENLFVGTWAGVFLRRVTRLSALEAGRDFGLVSNRSVLEATAKYCPHWLSGVQYCQAAADIVLAARAAAQKSVRQNRPPLQNLELAFELLDELYPTAEAPFAIVYAAAVPLAPAQGSHNATYEVMAGMILTKVSWGAGGCWLAGWVGGWLGWLGWLLRWR